jgi:N utilization substance protein A
MNNLGNIEILQIADAVARDKGILKDVVLSSMEEGIQVVAAKKYGHEHDIKAEINKKTGEIKIYKTLKVVEEVQDFFKEILLEDALYKNPDAKIGESISIILPPIDLGRVSAQAAKNTIAQKVKDAEREKEYHDFKGRVGDIINGTIKRIEFGNLIIDLGGRAEALLSRDDSIKSESYKVNDRIKAYVKDVVHSPKGPQIILSRTADGMVAKLFELEIPEVYDGNIKVISVARDPGSKSKVIVFANDSSVDAVGSCIGMKGVRIKAITNELNGEKIDVIQWSSDLGQFVMNALTPATISKVIIDEERRKVEIVVPEDQLSIAIGKRGQNVRLASRVVGWGIDVMTEDQESKLRTEEFNKSTANLMEILGVDEMMAQLLTSEGFGNLEQIASVNPSVIANIDGFDDVLASEVINRANAYLNAKNEEIISELEVLGVEQELLDSLSLSAADFLNLAEYGVKNIEDLGELTVQEFKKIVPNSGMSDDEISQMILSAKNSN